MSQTTAISPDTIRHLSFAKSLYIHAVEHATSDSILDRAIAIINFDSSIETFFYALIDYVGADVREKAGFNELMQAVKKKLPEPNVIEELSINNLHYARNGAQHHGIVPSISDVQRYKVIAYETLSKLSKLILKMEFEEISLADLIKDPMVKSLYKKAECAYIAGNFGDSLIFLAGAFERAKTIEQTKLWGSLIYFSLKKRAQEDQTIEKITEELEILKLRLDYKQYQKYREVFSFRISPFYYKSIANTEEETIKSFKEELCDLWREWQSNQQTEVLKNTTIYCLSFVLNSVLMWESVDRTGWPEILGQIFGKITDFSKDKIDEDRVAKY